MAQVSEAGTFDLSIKGLWHLWFEQKVQPDLGGARNFAWESLGLVEYSPIGTGVTLLQPIEATGKQLYSFFAVPLAGIPTQSGGMYLSPLYDPTLDPNFVPGG